MNKVRLLQQSMMPRRTASVVAGAILGYLAVRYAIEPGVSAAAPWLDTDSWAEGNWGGLGGLFGGGAAGGGGKAKNWLDDALGSPPGGSAGRPDKGGSEPGKIPDEDKTSYDMFEGIQDLLGEILGDDYKTAKDKFTNFSSGDSGIGDSEGTEPD